MCASRSPRGRAAVLAAMSLLGALVGALPADRPAPPAARAAQTKGPLTRESLAEFVKEPNKLAALRRGVKKMRELDSKDPRSWVFQANIHWRPFFPVYVWKQANASADPARQLFRDDPGFTPDPNVFNQCPHGNWWFLPWHRAYLTHFERILRWAAGDPTLNLPYWDYSDPDQRELPKAFRDRKAEGKDNPLYLPESASFKDESGQDQVFLMRDGPLLRGDTQLSAGVTSLKALDVVPFTTVKPLPGGQGFGSPAGCDSMCACGSGALESIPHNRLHTAVGGSSAMAGGSVRVGFMGTTETAARDPIFWVHHCNIDRLWASWDALGQGRRPPDDPAWLEQEFVFFDVDLASNPPGKPTAVRVTVKQLLTTARLGYRYDRLAKPPVAVARAPGLPDALPLRPVMRPLAAVKPTGAIPQPPHGKDGMPGGIRLTTGKPTTVPLGLGADVAPGQVRAVLTATPKKRKGPLVLSLEGITFPHLPGVDYEVYLNVPKDVTPTPETPYYLGTLTFFGLQHAAGKGGHGARAQYVKFAVPEALRELLGKDEGALADLRVTFVPQTGTEPTRRAKGRPAPVANRPGITIRQIRLVQIE
jgi:hypothetical protein